MVFGVEMQIGEKIGAREEEGRGKWEFYCGMQGVVEQEEE